jgi:hypothetical protein
MDVYGFNLSSDPEQYTVGSVTLFDEGDGGVTSLNEVQIGWEVSSMILACYVTCIVDMIYAFHHVFVSHIVLGFTR